MYKRQELNQAQKMEAIGRLAGGVAHDFNNLLTAINGCSELLLEDLGADDPSRESITEIHRAGLRAAELTAQLLAFGRRQMLAPRLVDLNGSVRGVSRIIERLIGEDIELQTTLSEPLPAIRADPGQLDQVVLNLALNARDAMPRGGLLHIRTTAQCLVQSQDLDAGGEPIVPGEYVELQLSDTGIGMSAHTIAHIFEPFYTTKGLGRGTGLGLAMVYGIVHQSGGHIRVRSELGKGTEISVMFPALAGDVVPQPQPAPVVDSEGTAHGTVLLVEDEAPVRRFVRKALENGGYTVLEASNGEEALQVAAGHGGPIDILLTDVVMPRMDGGALAQAMLQRWAGLKVVFMSGYTEDAVVRRGSLAAGSTFLQKPVSAAAILQALREVRAQAAV